MKAIGWQAAPYSSGVTAKLDVHRFVQDMRSALIYVMQENAFGMMQLAKRYAPWVGIDSSEEELKEMPLLPSTRAQIRSCVFCRRCRHS